MSNEEIAKLISKRRRQVLIHSVIYYKLDDCLVSDSDWTRWALELEELQRDYPEIAERCVYAEAFRDFDHSTGYHLPLDDIWANKKAKELITYAAKNKRSIW